MDRKQFCLEQAMGTREALFSFQALAQNCFINYEKAFDKVLGSKLFNILSRNDFGEKEIRCISNLYWGQTLSVGLVNDVTSDIAIKKEVREGSILSPMLFNIPTVGVYF